MTASGTALRLLAVLATPLAAQSVVYEGGMSVAGGDYIFTVPTTTWSLSTGAAIATGRFVLRATLPVHMQNTVLVTASGVGRMPSGGSFSGTVADSGRHGGGSGGRRGGGPRLQPPASAVTGYRVALGDPMATVLWRAVAGSRTSLSVGAGAKAPVADTATFGTGAWDVGVLASLTTTLGGVGFAGLDVSYWHLGDLPELEFVDPLTATVSVGRVFPTAWGGSLFATAGTASLRGYDAPVLVGASVTRLGTPAAWGGSVAIGLTDTVAAYAATLTWRVRLLE